MYVRSISLYTFTQTVGYSAIDLDDTFFFGRKELTSGMMASRLLIHLYTSEKRWENKTNNNFLASCNRHSNCVLSRVDWLRAAR